MNPFKSFNVFSPLNYTETLETFEVEIGISIVLSQ